MAAADRTAFQEHAAAVAEVATFTDMGRAGHHMLRGVPARNAFALVRVRRILSGERRSD